MTASSKTSAVSLLVVDDRPENRTALRAILETSYNVVEASSGTEALRQLLDQEFAVLLVDIVMPEMSGFELAEIIRKRERTAAVPILFITAAATDGHLVFQGYEVGAVDFLTKPIDPEIVRAKVAVFAQLFRQRKQIESSLREKEVLLREVHHRVKNNLQIITSLLHLQSNLQPPAVRAILAESEARVRSIALVHENLYRTESFALIDVDHYLESLVSPLLAMFGAQGVKASVNRHGVQLPIDTALSCGLIVNELVSNALKHAFPGHRQGTITISLSETTADELLLEVRDDGIGMPDSVDLNHMKSMGLRLVASLSTQLAARVELERSHGTSVLFHFPAHADTGTRTADAANRA